MVSPQELERFKATAKKLGLPVRKLLAAKPRKPVELSRRAYRFLVRRLETSGSAVVVWNEKARKARIFSQDGYAKVRMSWTPESLAHARQVRSMKARARKPKKATPAPVVAA